MKHCATCNCPEANDTAHPYGTCSGCGAAMPSPAATHVCVVWSRFIIDNTGCRPMPGLFFTVKM